MEPAAGGCRAGGPRPAALWVLPGLCLGTAALLGALDWNRSLFLLLNGGWGGEALWARVTILGDALVVLVLLLPFVGRRPMLVWAALLAAIVASLAVHGFKLVLDWPRPAAVLEPGLVEIIGPVHRRFSLPSGHSASAFTLAGILVLCLGRWAWLAAAAALPVALSRVMVGAHWPADVLAGAAVGWLAAAAGLWLARRLSWGATLPAQRLFAAGLLVAAAGLWFLDTGYPAARDLQRIVAVLAPLAALPGLLRVFRYRRAG